MAKKSNQKLKTSSMILHHNFITQLYVNQTKKTTKNKKKYKIAKNAKKYTKKCQKTRSKAENVMKINIKN